MSSDDILQEQNRNTFSNEGKRIVTSKSALQEILKTVPICHVGPQHPPHPLPCHLTVPFNLDIPPLPLDQFRDLGVLGLGPEARKKAKELCMGHGILGGRMAPNTTTDMVRNLRQASCLL